MVKRKKKQEFNPIWLLIGIVAISVCSTNQQPFVAGPQIPYTPPQEPYTPPPYEPPALTFNCDAECRSIGYDYGWEAFDTPCEATETNLLFGEHSCCCGHEAEEEEDTCFDGDYLYHSDFSDLTRFSWCSDYYGTKNDACKAGSTDVVIEYICSSSLCTGIEYSCSAHFGTDWYCDYGKCVFSPPSGEDVYNDAVCTAYMSSMGKEHHSFANNLDECLDIAWVLCDNLGTSLKYTDFDDATYCCVWSCW